MHADTAELGGLVGQSLRREAARWWWAPLAAGIVWFLIAWAVLRLDVTSLATVGVLVGLVFLVATISEGGMAALAMGGWTVVHLVLAVVFLLGALWAFIRPIDTFFALASVLGLLILIQGVVYIARSSATRELNPYWWVGLVCGVLIALLGLWISTSDRVWDLAARAVFILLCVGFYAVFRGINDIVLAFELRRLPRGFRGPAPEVVGEPPTVTPPEGGDARTEARRDTQPRATPTV